MYTYYIQNTTTTGELAIKTNPIILYNVPYINTI